MASDDSSEGMMDFMRLRRASSESERVLASTISSISGFSNLSRIRISERRTSFEVEKSK